MPTDFGLQKRSTVVLSIALALAGCGATSAAAPTSPTAAPSSASDKPLRDSVDRLVQAWNAGNAAAWADEYWPDGSLVNILGVVYPDAAGVRAVTNQILSGPFKGSNFQASVRRVRFLGEAAAIVETDVSVTNFRALPPGAVATAPGLLLTRFTYVFENRNGVWKIEASQNTSVLPTPSAQSASVVLALGTSGRGE